MSNQIAGIRYSDAQGEERGRFLSGSCASQREDAEKRDREATERERIRWARDGERKHVAETSSNSCSPGTSAQRRSATRHGEHHRDAATPWRFGSCPPSSSRCCAALRCPLGIAGIRQRRTREDAEPVNNVPRYSGTPNQAKSLPRGKTQKRKRVCLIYFKD